MLGAVLYSLVGLYTLFVIIRLIIEMIQSFSKHFAPPRWFMVVGEFFFVVTDPPIKFLRRFIPPLPLGAVALDVSVIVLFLVLAVLQTVIRSVML
ncbi:YggT family protein [Corynebacterium urinipleomorphum]|uniref:YggT family protein n=1 Tax=Corynebacterium urinipleomorphum TaxID=1852380 RepID=UPI00194DAFB0|nr:YggT family protein [Corynebacterium urinipleomorphum]